MSTTLLSTNVPCGTLMDPDEPAKIQCNSLCPASIMIKGMPMRFSAWFVVIAVLFAGSNSVLAECNLADVEVSITEAVWHNRCSKKNCAELKGTAMLVSRCNEPVGVLIRLSGRDADGAVIAQRELWPYAISNVSAGEHSFSISKWLKYDAAIREFRIDALAVKTPDH